MVQFQKYIYCFFLCCLTLIVKSQSPILQHITDAEGLPSMTIYDILQDQKGYIWLGTDAGICRYDGYKFQIIEVPSSKGRSFSTLKQDKTGRIYFLNFANQLFYIENNKATEMTLPKSCQKTGFYDYNLDKNGNVYLLGSEIYVYDIEQEKWFLDFEGAKKIENGYLVFDKNNEVWALTNLGLIAKTGQKYITKRNPNETFHSVYQINQTIYLSNTQDNKILRYEEDKNIWKSVFPEAQKLKQNSIVKFFGDNEENVWILTRAGAMCFDKNNRPLYNGLVFLKDKFVSSFIQDREGNYWFTTIGEGIFVMYNKDFLTYNADNSILPFTQINRLTQDDKQNIIIAGNFNQVLEFSPEKNTFHSYNLPEADVECVLLDKKNNQIFIENGHLHLFDTKHKSKIDSLHAGATPKDMAILSDKLLLIAAGNSAYIIDKKGAVPEFEGFGKVIYYNNPNINNPTLLLRNKRSRAVWVEQAKSRFWVGYADGLYYYEKGKEKELKTRGKQEIIALDIAEDKNHILWVATAKQGVFGIQNKKIIEHFTANNGLISNFCRVIKIDNDKLWIGTDKGLQLLYLKKNKINIFTQEDGLASNEIKDIAVQGNKVWVASSKGLTVFDKNFENTNYVAPLIYITDVAIWEKSQKLKKQYMLDYQDNNLKIEFVGLAFHSNKNFKYRYRLVGLNDEWVTVKSQINFVRYPSLPPGKYKFEVKVINKDGVESDQTATISIEVLKPFWQKWWFITLVILTSLAVLSLGFWYRIRTIQRKNKLEKDVLQANLSALKVQMNPHFIFNSLSSIQNYMLTGKKDDADRYLSKFAKLTRKVLEASRKDYVNIEEEVEILNNYLELEKLYAEKEFEYQINIDKKIHRTSMKVPPLFAQPFIENAIKHGIHPLESGGEILVSFSLVENLILLEIKDNGVGRNNSKNLENSKKHNSLSTKITKERLQIFQETINKAVRMEIADILDENQEVAGTSVKLFLPYQSL